MKRISFTLIPFSCLLITLAATPSSGAAAATNFYFRVNFDLASHEQVDRTNGSRIVVRQITTQDIIYGLALYGYIPITNTNTSNAQLLERVAPDNSYAYIVRNGTNEYDVTQSFDFSYPNSPYYHAVMADITTPFGAHRDVVQRIARITFTGGNTFELQGFSTVNAITNNGHFYTSWVLKVSGSGSTITRGHPTPHDAVLEGTFNLFGPIALTGPPHPF